MCRKIWHSLLGVALLIILSSNAFALIDKADMPIGGSGFDDATDITAGTYYFIELSDLSGSSFFGYDGSYRFVAPENGTYYFYGKNITSSSMGISVYNRYQEFVCGTGDDGFAGLASNWFEDSRTYSALLEQGETYVVHIRARGKVDFAICTPSHHVLAGDWEITKPASCQPGEMSQKCVACGTVLESKELKPTGHIPGEWTMTTEPSLFWPGEKTQICTVCGKVLNTAVVPATGIPLDSFKLSKTKIILGVGQKYTFTWTVSPSDADWSFNFSSSNPHIVALSDSVIDNGYIITAKKVGSTVVKVTGNNGKSKTIKVTVKAAPKKVALNKTGTITLKKGKKLQLKAKLTPKDAFPTITWTSSDKRIAKVDKNGKVSAIKKGSVVITAKTYNGKLAKVKIKVK